MSKQIGDVFEHPSLGDVRVVEFYGNADVKKAYGPITESFDESDENHYDDEWETDLERPSGLYLVPEPQAGEAAAPAA